jgi:hypothetical protein
MPHYLRDPQVWMALWPLVLFPLAASVLLALCVQGGRKDYASSLAAIFALSLLGITAGQLTGLSRDSAVGTVLPAVLTLVGGVVVYLVGVKRVQSQRLICLAVIGLTLNLLVGGYWGSSSRIAYEEYVQSSEVLAARAVAEEKARHLQAIQKLLDQQEYDSVKAEMEREKTP